MTILRGAKTPAFIGMSVPDKVFKQYKIALLVMAGGALKLARTSGPEPVKSKTPLPSWGSMSMRSLTMVPSSKRSMAWKVRPAYAFRTSRVQASALSRMAGTVSTLEHRTAIPNGLTFHIKVHGVTAVLLKQGLHLGDTDRTSRALRFEVRDVVIESLGGQAAGILSGLHEGLGDFLFVEHAIADDEGRLEGDTFLGAAHGVGMMRVAGQTADVGVMASRSDPEQHVDAVGVKDRLDDGNVGKVTTASFRGVGHQEVPRSELPSASLDLIHDCVLHRAEMGGYIWSVCNKLATGIEQRAGETARSVIDLHVTRADLLQSLLDRHRHCGLLQCPAHDLGDPHESVTEDRQLDRVYSGQIDTLAGAEADINAVSISISR